jgi:hypothetical protein
MCLLPLHHRTMDSIVGLHECTVMWVFPQNIVILKIMFVSLLCMTLFDMVLYFLTYQLLSCIHFVDIVTEINGQ